MKKNPLIGQTDKGNSLYFYLLQRENLLIS